MKAETNLSTILKTLAPELNDGDYVFCTVDDHKLIDSDDTICTFRETEGLTVIIKKELADKLELSYTTVLSWITLTVHSSLEAVGLTATFSTALAAADISCNVVAASYHDHIFVPKGDALHAMKILEELSR
jgi:hypothetical protein